MSFVMANRQAEYISAKDNLFIATECHLATMQDEDGDTPLHIAVVKGNAEQCIKLCELFRMAMKSIDVYNKLYQTPLHIATITNKTNIIEILLENGANPNKPDRNGSTCVHLCAQFKATESLCAFVEKYKHALNLAALNYEGLSAVHVAVIKNAIPVFKILVNSGADVDAMDTKSGRTPLIYAIERNRLDLVEHLLECDANVGQQTFSGDTALHIASGRGLQDIVRLLLRRGADASAKHVHSDVPMTLAKSSNEAMMPRVAQVSAKQISTGSGDSNAIYSNSKSPTHIIKNTNVPMPPDLLQRNILHGNANLQSFSRSPKKRVGKQKIKEEPDAEIPLKRMAPDYKITSFSGNGTSTTTTSIYSKSFSSNSQLTQKPTSSGIIWQPQQTPLLPPISHIPMPPVPEYENQLLYVSKPSLDSKKNLKVLAKSGNASNQNKGEQLPLQSNPEDDDRMVYEEQSMEPLAIAAEETVPCTDQGSPSKASSGMKFKKEVVEPIRSIYSEETYVKNPESSKSPSKAPISPSNIYKKTKAVIVQRTPQINEPSALQADGENDKRFKLDSPSDLNAVPGSTNRFSQTFDKSSGSSSVGDTSLYRLAQEGMAVAVMAQINSGIGLHRSLNSSAYKIRPTRQAKIKSGTQELQNLALQGLAVAAMNTKSEEAIEQEKRANLDNKRNDVPPCNVTQIPSRLSKVLEKTNPMISFPMQRSHSMPLGNNDFYTKMEPGYGDMTAKSDLLKIESDRAKGLLALANATVQKRNVGQAVSAFSMAKPMNAVNLSQTTTNLNRSNSGPSTSELTKIELRNALLEKPSSTIKSGKQNKDLKLVLSTQAKNSVQPPVVHKVFPIPTTIDAEKRSNPAENLSSLSPSAETSENTSESMSSKPVDQRHHMITTSKESIKTSNPVAGSISSTQLATRLDATRLHQTKIISGPSSKPTALFYPPSVQVPRIISLHPHTSIPVTTPKSQASLETMTKSSNATTTPSPIHPSLMKQAIEQGHPLPSSILSNVTSYNVPEQLHHSMLPAQHNEAGLPIPLIQSQLQQLHQQAFVPPRYMQQLVYIPIGKQYYPYVVPVSMPEGQQVGMSPLPLQYPHHMLHSPHNSHSLIQSSVIQSPKHAGSTDLKEVKTIGKDVENSPAKSTQGSVITTSPTRKTKATVSKTKPVATITPQKPYDEDDDQPLNLSKKAKIEPLNLMTSDKKSDKQDSSNRVRRPSVIKEVTQSETSPSQSLLTQVTVQSGVTTQPRLIAPTQMQPNLLPPIIMPQPSIGNAALASYSYLPPIHYVPGMQYVCPPPPTTFSNQPKSS